MSLNHFSPLTQTINSNLIVEEILREVSRGRGLREPFGIGIYSGIGYDGGSLSGKIVVTQCALCSSVFLCSSVLLCWTTWGCVMGVPACHDTKGLLQNQTSKPLLVLRKSTESENPLHGAAFFVVAVAFHPGTQLPYLCTNAKPGIASCCLFLGWVRMVYCM